MLWIVPSLVVAGGIVVAGRRARAGAPDDSPDITPRPTRPELELDGGRIDVRALALSIGAPSVWADFFAFTSYGESKRRPDVGLGKQTGAPAWVPMNVSSAEAHASAVTYQNNITWLEPCWPRENYVFGSGGLFAMFPASALAAFKGNPLMRCNHPWSIFDPSPTMIYAAWFARRLQGWKNWLGTVESTRVGWGNPSGMGKPASAEQRKRWSNHLEAVGLPQDFLATKLPRWKPAPAEDLWSALDLGTGWLPPSMLEAA
jgi:hypothetical protein